MACCALPVLITVAVVGAGAGVVGRLPAIAAALAVLAVGAWWVGQRRAARGCGTKGCGAGGCGCRTTDGLLRITPAARR
ncbi:hypothetical protein ASE03_00735 [Kitasatospora sp. Root187]|nr:hypothetical protein ASE03_00735 [Kitasatospora sp. Root187]